MTCKIRRPEDVANVSYIRLLLNRGNLIGSSYDTMAENDLSSKDPEQTQTSAKKSRACCVM